MTLHQIARLGHARAPIRIMAGLGVLIGVVGMTALPSSAQGVVKPLTASGCTGNTVCIDVEGSGLNVTEVTGGISTPGGVMDCNTWKGYMTIYAIFPGTTAHDILGQSGTGTATCLSPFTYGPLNETGVPFSNGTKICAEQYTDSGYYNPGGGNGACETVES